MIQYFILYLYDILYIEPEMPIGLNFSFLYFIFLAWLS